MAQEYRINEKKNVLSIPNSYKIVSTRQMVEFLRQIQQENPEEDCLVVRNRDLRGLVMEWRAHNLLYDWHIFPIHTRDVDFEYPQKWFFRIGFRIMSSFYFKGKRF